MSVLLGLSDVEPDTRDNEGRPPLSYAAQMGHYSIVKLFLERNDVESDA